MSAASPSHLDQVNELRTLLQLAERKASELAALPVDHSWPREAGSLSDTISVALTALLRTSGDLYGLTPAEWQLRG